MREVPTWLRVLVIGAVFAGVVLRFTGLERKIYWFNEVFTALRVHGYDEHDEVIPRLYTGQPVTGGQIRAFQERQPDRSLADTIRGLARKEPQQTPAYYALARLAVQASGHTIVPTRAVAALFGVLGIFAAYWFAKELFGMESAGWIAAGLMGLSPLFIRYAQEARSYTMWLTLFMLASTVFLRAVRRPGVRPWLAYAGVMTLALYSHLLSALVLVAHGLCWLAFGGLRMSWLHRGFLLAASSSVVAFSPWLLVILRRQSTFLATTGHLTSPEPFDYLIRRWLFDISHLFNAWPLRDNGPLLLLGLVALALIGYAFHHARQHASRISWLILVSMAVVPVAAFVLLDLSIGGQRSIRPRYLFPAFVAAQLAVAFLLARKWSVNRIWRGLTVVILLAGLVSAIVVIRERTWWGLAEVDLDILQILNEDPGALVVTDLPYGVVAPLSFRLKPDVRFLLTRIDEAPRIPAGVQDVYAYQPSEKLMRQLEDAPGSRLELIYRKARWERTVYSLYRVVRE
jgi:uncharacterized membrane protein